MNDRLFRKQWLDNIILWILQESEFQLVDNSAQQLFWVSARFAATQTRLEQLYMQVGEIETENIIMQNRRLNIYNDFF